MPNPNDELICRLATFIENTGIDHYDELLAACRSALDGLAKTGTVKLKGDFRLGGAGLEIRVRLILERMGLTVRWGREKLEDLTVDIPECAGSSIPLVVEVKSGRRRGPSRDDLRQLDDWVFELSGESEIRGNGVRRQGGPAGHYKGAVPPASTHPSPHKGVLIYNGPLGVPFEDRQTSMLDVNESEFAHARHFCVASLSCLLSWANACDDSGENLRSFWNQVQGCRGELAAP